LANRPCGVQKRYKLRDRRADPVCVSQSRPAVSATATAAAAAWRSRGRQGSCSIVESNICWTSARVGAPPETIGILIDGHEHNLSLDCLMRPHSDENGSRYVAHRGDRADP